MSFSSYRQIGIVMITALVLTGCSYRLIAPPPPSSYGLTLIARSPELYKVHVQGRDYPAGADGKVVFNASRATARSCRIYLFNRIPINRVPDPLQEKIISVRNQDGIVQTLSWKDILKLPVDSNGDPLVTMGSAR